MLKLFISARSLPFRRWMRNQWKWHAAEHWSPIIQNLQRLLVGGYVNGVGNKIKMSVGEIKKVRLEIDGDENTVKTGGGCYLYNVRIFVRGSRNLVQIGDSVRLVNTDIYACGDECRVSVGSLTSVEGGKFAAAESRTSLTLGQDCLLSEGIEIRTGDSHGAYGSAGERINIGRDVAIADRVWIGKNVMVLKGTCVASDCILGANSLVSGRFEKAGCVIAGNPASVKRENIFWRRDIKDRASPQLHQGIGIGQQDR